MPACQAVELLTRFDFQVDSLLCLAKNKPNVNLASCQPTTVIFSMNATTHPLIRHDWTRAEVKALFELPFSDLMFQAQTVHRAFFNPNEVQVSTLCSIKTGACPEDCAYCPQSARYDTGLEREKLMAVEKVIEEAKAAKASG